MSDARAGQTAINHNRCLFITAGEFFTRVRAAQALTEDFDGIVEEFGRGCPCKNPPLKSKGKAHLKSSTHDKAFNKSDGKFFGMSVRDAFLLPVDVVRVQGAQRLGGVENGGEEDLENRFENEQLDFDEMDDHFEADDSRAAEAAAVEDDDDVSDIVVEDP